LSALLKRKHGIQRETRDFNGREFSKLQSLSQIPIRLNFKVGIKFPNFGTGKEVEFKKG